MRRKAEFLSTERRELLVRREESGRRPIDLGVGEEIMNQEGGQEWLPGATSPGEIRCGQLQ